MRLHGRIQFKPLGEYLWKSYSPIFEYPPFFLLHKRSNRIHKSLIVAMHAKKVHFTVLFWNLLACTKPADDHQRGG
jgi:hypothetical protein